MSEWISVEGELPKEGDKVLLYSGIYGSPCFWFASRVRDRIFRNECGWERDGEVTHWMPLPEPPK